VNPLRRSLEDMLARGPAQVRFHVASPGVRLPASVFHAAAWLRLDYKSGQSMEISDEGLKVTVSFSGVPCPIVVPWAAVYFVQSLAGEYASMEWVHKFGETSVQVLR